MLGRLLEGLSSIIIFTSGPTLLVDIVGQKEIRKVVVVVVISYLTSNGASKSAI